MADDNTQGGEQNGTTASSENQNTQSTTQEAKTSSAKPSFGEALKNFLNRGAAATMKGLRSAGDAISDFGDTTVTSIDISQLKSKLEKKYQELGEKAFNELTGAGQVTRDTEGITDMVSAIDDLKKQISEKEASVEAIRQKSKKQ